MNKFNFKFLFLISLVSAMGGLLFGYDFIVIAGAKPFYEPFFGITTNPAMQGWAVSSALVGCLIGALGAGAFADRWGRKIMLIMAAFLFVVSAIGTGAVNDFNWFIFYRIVGGLGIGIASNLSPMYIAEVSPSHYRGRLVSLNQLTIVIGILVAQIANMYIKDPTPDHFTTEMIRESWNGQTAWRWMFWAENVPALAFFVMAFFLPESPRWLSTKHRKQDAERVWEKIGGKVYAEREYNDVITTMNAHKAEAQGGFRALLRPSMRNVLIIGIVLAAFQQWCGINVIFNYADEIFKGAGFSIDGMFMNVVITGITNLVCTFIAIFTVDRLGRRPLLILGAAGLTITYLLLGGCYFFEIKGWVPVVFVMIAIACYAMTLAPIMWVVLSEIFPNAIRGAAMATAVFVLWAACFTLTYTFPLLNKGLGTYGTFWLYGFICLLGLVFIYKKVPETKNKSLEEIENELIK